MTDEIFRRFERTALLLGEENLNKLADSSVLIFGLGGVGGYALEALARAGIGNFTIVDGDKVDITNINRQIIAADGTVGKMKAAAFEERIRKINPSCTVKTVCDYYTAENSDIFDFSEYGYVVDAVDMVSAKLLIIEKAAAAGVPVISAMGTARKLDPTKLRIGDIYETRGCPLARVMRRELRKRGIKSLNVVWSPEEPVLQNGNGGRGMPIGSVPFVPPVAGMYIAGKVISDITEMGGLYG